jgi:hypothetical protein
VQDSYTGTECDSRLQRFTGDGKLLSVHEHCLAEHSDGVLEQHKQRRMVSQGITRAARQDLRLVQSNPILDDDI